MVDKISQIGKKVLFITSTEQSALKYKADLISYFDNEATIYPYQNSSLYEDVPLNLYDYAAQIRELFSPSNIIITPIKALMEKIPDRRFFKENSLNLKIGDEITQKDLLNKLMELGYKRATMVSDISEFSIRGDIADIYTLNENPVRIEFWGDEIADIRLFNNKTQKSIEKIKTISILPLYKFILPENTGDLSKILAGEVAEKIEEESYFEGINLYQSYLNNNLVSIFNYFKDYIVVFDEYAEVSSKLNQIIDGYNNSIKEILKTTPAIFGDRLNHYTEQDIVHYLGGFQKISLNNFLSDENNEVLDIDSKNIQIFDADIEKVAQFILSKKDYKIIIATDYKERVNEILSEWGIFNVDFIDNTNATGTEIPEAKIIFITDRELFNKRQKNVTSERKKCILLLKI